jgi:hypothetical protein
MLSDESKKLDSAVDSTFKFIFKMAASNPETVRVILQECLHKLDMVQKIKGKMENVTVEE